VKAKDDSPAYFAFLLFSVMPRYVILEHDHPSRHWDFMLETGKSLRTWRLEAWPEDGARIRAEPIGDHRLIYLDYEGPLSGDRGRVLHRDEGMYTGEVALPLCVTMTGRYLKGTVTITEDAARSWWFRYVSETS
jgi:hypothetical protein